MLFFGKILICIILTIDIVSYDLLWLNSIFNNGGIHELIIVRERRPRRPRRQRRERIEPTEPSKKKSTCPENSENLEILVADLIKDLPGYINREIQRDRQPNEDYLKRNIIIAGRPEFEPLPIEYTPFLQEDIKQVFLTTLERQYQDSLVIELQRFHWLFLKKNQTGWELIKMLSIENNQPFQPENSSNGVVAKGVRTWLQGCHFEDRTRKSENNQ